MDQFCVHDDLLSDPGNAVNFTLLKDECCGCVPGTFVRSRRRVCIWVDPWEVSEFSDAATLERPLFHSRVDEVFLVVAITVNNLGNSWFFMSGSRGHGWISRPILRNCFSILVRS